METNRGAEKKSVLDISVRNPMTHNTWDKGRYTDYEIVVNTSNKSFCLSSSSTRRRYSEFEWLRNTLKNHHPLVTPPDLPPKKYFGDRFDPNFIAFRMKALEGFLNSLLKEKHYLSDTTMHLFLQTNLNVKEIKEYIEGKVSAYSLDSLWKANGVKENCREFCEYSSEENGDWTHVAKDIKPKSETLSVICDREDLRDSNNSDISTSFSDDEEVLKEFPSVTLISKNIQNCSVSGDQDFNVSSGTSGKLLGRQNNTVKSKSKTLPSDDDGLLNKKTDEESNPKNIIPHKNLYKEVELDASSVTDLELESVANFNIEDKYSINSVE